MNGTSVSLFRLRVGTHFHYSHANVFTAFFLITKQLIYHMLAHIHTHHTQLQMFTAGAYSGNQSIGDICFENFHRVEWIQQSTGCLSVVLSFLCANGLSDFCYSRLEFDLGLSCSQGNEF